MPKEEIKDLTLFMQPYPREVREIALFLREFAWDLYPQCNELIYDNYNAVAFGWSLTDKLSDTFCFRSPCRELLSFWILLGNLYR